MQASERAEKRRRKRLEMADKKNYAQRQEEMQRKKVHTNVHASPPPPVSGLTLRRRRSTPR